MNLGEANCPDGQEFVSPAALNYLPNWELSLNSFFYNSSKTLICLILFNSV